MAASYQSRRMSPERTSRDPETTRPPHAGGLVSSLQRWSYGMRWTGLPRMLTSQVVSSEEIAVPSMSY